MEFPEVSGPSELSALLWTSVVELGLVVCALACQAHAQSSPPATSKSAFMKISFSERCRNVGLRRDEAHARITSSTK